SRDRQRSTTTPRRPRPSWNSGVVAQGRGPRLHRLPPADVTPDDRPGRAGALRAAALGPCRGRVYRLSPVGSFFFRRGAGAAAPLRVSLQLAGWRERRRRRRAALSPARSNTSKTALATRADALVLGAVAVRHRR